MTSLFFISIFIFCSTLGHHYQAFSVRNNYIAHNSIDHRNVVLMSGVSANFSYATITDNTGMTMLNSSLPEQVLFPTTPLHSCVNGTFERVSHLVLG